MAVRVKFNKGEFRRELLQRKKLYEDEQTARLIAYAEEQMQLIGAEIEPYFGHSYTNTGNMLDSLCWGVWFDGKLKKSGYYREKQAEFDSYLHELSIACRTPVDGRFLAQQFLANYKAVKQGWSVAWGVLAPYYPYWETGHENVLIGDVEGFYIMTQRYDHIQNQLGTKCVTRIEINRAV